MFQLDNVKNAAILRDFLNFRSWQEQKRSNSGRLPHFSTVTTSKTKQFCETSFKNRKLSAELTASYQCVFAICPLHLPKVLSPPRKSDARSYEVLHLSRKSILENLKIWCSEMQPLSGNQRPGLLTCLINMSLVLHRPCELHLAVLRATTPCTFSTSQLPKVLRAWCALYVFTSNCASRHNGVHFFHIPASKSGPTLVCFVHFDFQMCFAPKRRAIFHLASSQMAPHPAALASLLFDLPEPQIIGKNAVFRDFSTFSRTCIVFLLTLSLLWSSLFFSSLLWLFPPLLFRLSRSLTSKLPSTIYFNIFQCHIPVFAQLKFQGHWVLASHPCPFQIHVLRHSSSIFLLRHGLSLRGRSCNCCRKASQVSDDADIRLPLNTPASELRMCLESNCSDWKSHWLQNRGTAITKTPPWCEGWPSVWNP